MPFGDLEVRSFDGKRLPCRSFEGKRFDLKIVLRGFCDRWELWLRLEPRELCLLPFDDLREDASLERPRRGGCAFHPSGRGG